MRMVRLHRDEKGSAKYLEEVVKRIEDFSQMFHGNPIGMGNLVWSAYASKDPGLHLAIAVDDDDHITGHAIGLMREQGREWVGWLYQCEMDVWSDRELRSVYLNELERWGERWNLECQRVGRNDMIVRELILATPHDPKVMARMTGFTLQYHVMRRPLLAWQGR